MNLLHIVTPFCIVSHFTEANYGEHFKNHSASGQYIGRFQASAKSELNNSKGNQNASIVELNVNQTTDNDVSGKVEYIGSLFNRSSPFLYGSSVRTCITYRNTPVLLDRLIHRQFGYSKYGNKSFNSAIIGIGIHNFMSYAVYFCKHEAQGGAIEIISVGSGDGSVDRSIIKAYRSHFGSTLNIILVDNNPAYEVDFRTVDNLIEKRPNIVGNCCLLIIWPEPVYFRNMTNSYDIDSIRKLQPLAVLTLYETTGISGSHKFQMFLDKDKRHYEWWDYPSAEGNNVTLLNQYAVEEVVYQKVYFNAVPGTPRKCYCRLRMVKVKRIS